MPDNDQLATALAKIADLEARLSNANKRQEIPADVRNAILRDPAGVLEQLGVLDSVTKALAAKAMGPNAPQNLILDARTGTQAALLAAYEQEIVALRQRVDSMDSKARLVDTKGALQKIAADKTKYPHLASALVNDDGLFDRDIEGHRGTADELAQAIEARLATTAKALGITAPPASQKNADDAKTTATSTQAKAQSTGTMAGDPPPLPRSQPGSGFSEAEQKALRDEIVRNFERGVYNVPDTTPPQ